MGLITCKDCDKTYSSEARSCIHCGAPNPNSKKSKSLGDRVIEWTGGLAIMGVVAYLTAYGFSSPSDVANGKVLQSSDFECSNTQLNKTFKSTFEGSPYALSNNLKVVLIKSTNHPPVTEDSKVTCESTISLNNGETVTYIFNVRNQKNGEYDYIVEGEPTEPTNPNDTDI